MSRSNTRPATKPATKPAAIPNTPATAQTGNTAEVLATVASQEATQAASLQNPSNSAHGNEGSLPPVGAATAIAVKVTSEVEGFRRAGLAWSRTSTVIELDEATISVLEAEPLLTVARLGAAVEKTAG